MHSIALFLCASLSLIAGDYSNTGLVELLRKVRDHQKEIDKVEENYTYNEVVADSTIDKKGLEKPSKTERFEVFHVKGVRIRKLTSRNGQPLSAGDQKNEDKRVAKIIEAIEAGRPPKPTRRQVTISDLLRGTRLVNGRQESFRDRTVVVCDFEPDPAYKPRDSYDAFVTKIRGTLWVDEVNLQVTQVKFATFAPLKVGGGLLFAIQPGSEFFYTQERVNDEIWLPKSTDVKFLAKAMMFAGIRIREKIERSDYKRFNVESMDRGAKK